MLQVFLKSNHYLYFTAFAVIVAAAVQLTFPLDRISSPNGDIGQMVWNIYFSTESILSGLNPYSSNDVTFPVQSNLTQHTLAAGYSIIGVISKIIFGNDLYPFIEKGQSFIEKGQSLS